jgi:hypothetical protein
MEINMRFEDLSAEDQKLLSTDLGDFEKEAAAEVALAQDMYETGFSKLATETADYLDSLLEKVAEEKEDDKEDDADEETKKTASDLGAFIERGFFDGLCKLGQERHNDETYYLVPYLEEKVAENARFKAVGEFMKRMGGKAKEIPGKAKDFGNKAKGKVVDYHKDIGKGFKEGYQGMKASVTGKGTGINPGKALSKDERITAGKEGLKSIGKSTAKVLPHVGAVGLGGLAAKKALSGKKES